MSMVSDIRIGQSLTFSLWQRIKRFYKNEYRARTYCTVPVMDIIATKISFKECVWVIIHESIHQALWSIGEWNHRILDSDPYEKVYPEWWD